jgi:AcrR family transcriptional regulator
MPTASPVAPPGSTRTRLLEATGRALARSGPRKLSLTDIAALAGVSRPTLYRHFASKEELLLALAAHEKQRFEAELAAALKGLTGAARLDRALRFVVEFQRDHAMRGLVAVEPAFMLDQLERALRTMSAALVPLFEPRRRAGGPARAADLADLVVRIASSHFLIPGDDDQLLRELRHVAGTGA